MFQTKKENIVDDINGIKIPDPYRWLENAQDPEVKDWIQQQNEHMEAVLKNDTFHTFSNELATNLKVSSYSNPIPVFGRYFYTERKPDEDQAVLYVKDGLKSEPVELFNPNGKRKGNTVTIDYWVVSYTGAYVAYGISEGGDEMSTIYIKNTITNQELSEHIIHCRFSSVSWLPDDTGFFYTRNARPGTVPKNEEHLHGKLFFHKLGTNPDDDEPIFGAGRPKDDMIHVSMSPDGMYVGVQASQNWSQNELYIFERATNTLKPIVTGVVSKFSVTFLDDKVLLYTDYKANNFRVLWARYEDMYEPVDEWKELISERPVLLNTFRCTKSKILVEYLVNVCSEVFIFDHDGREIGKIPLPPYSSLAKISSRRNEEEFFYGVESFLFPKIIYRYDLATATYVECQRIESPIRPSDYNIRQEWYVSKDGTKVPMFIFYKKGLQLNGSNPTLLYGYGGFNNNLSPAFMRNWVPWTERGGVFAVANIRGGGEFGDTWHKGGIKMNKQNTFDDFIAAAEYLISQKYTDTSHLGIIGGSNGGLLVAAVGVQRPDLFTAICSRVPLTDMVRFPKFGIAVRWMHEYGNPEVPEDLKN
ncbi:MAG: prolyl oligopeptidase family serine peptidase, partial [bacterium]